LGSPTRRLCVFCGANPGRRPEYLEAARALAKVATTRGIGIVYGGGNAGVMGALADAMTECGGEVIGVMPQHLVNREISHSGLTELRIVHTMHQRKQLMHDLSDGFAALPGGLGTLEEIAEVLTWSQLELHQKPCGIFNVLDYYTPLLDFFRHASQEGLVRPQSMQRLVVEKDPATLLTRLFEPGLVT
jgi:uncharacterized protein (TIGR00730 family)